MRGILYTSLVCGNSSRHLEVQKSRCHQILVGRFKSAKAMYQKSRILVRFEFCNILQSKFLFNLENSISFEATLSKEKKVMLTL